MATYRLFSNINGPSSPVSYSGPFLAGVLFQVTTGGVWFEGYWWWVCNTGQSIAAQKFALWEVYADGSGTLIPAATITSNSLAAGQWNYIALATPVPLALGACYNACTGFAGSFPDTNGQFGTGEPYSAGITSGPLSAFSDLTGTLPAPFSMTQGVFGTAGTDPSVNMPAQGSGSDNFWMDLQVTDAAPAGSSYRLWPNYPTIPATSNEDNLEQTFGTEFLLSEACTLNNIWYYSPPAVSPPALPTICAIWDVKTQQVVLGTQDSSPSWSGTAGSGWVACGYSGVILPPGDYKVSVYTPGGSDNFYQETEDYWGTGAGANGIVSGPLTAPNTADATTPGQATYYHGAFAYPDTYDTAFDGQNRWVDIEVTPSTGITTAAPSGSSSTANSKGFLTFFP